MIKKYTCTSCWFYAFIDVFSTSEVCNMCWLEDDITSTLSPYIPLSRNWNTLIILQQEILKKIPYNIKKYKKGKKEYIRNLLWKPIDKDKLDKNHDYFPRWKFEEFHDKYPKYSEHNRKLMEEAQKYNPDDKVHLD